MSKFKFKVYMTDTETNERKMLCKSRTREGAIKNAQAWYNDQMSEKFSASEEQRRWATRLFNTMEIVEE